MLDDIYKTIFSRPFKVSMFLFMLIIISSNLKWMYDEYFIHQNMYSIFSKLIITDCTSYYSLIYCLMLPLLSSAPFCWYYSKKLSYNNYNITISDTFKSVLASFISGMIMVFVSCVIDFLLLSMITKTEYAVPNDMTTTYDSSRFCSKIFFEYPRLFVFLWSVIISFLGGAFSLLSMSLCFIFKKVYVIYFIIMLLSIINFAIAPKLRLSPWVNILNASYSNQNTINVIVWNVISIFSLAIIIITFRFDKIKNRSLYEK